MPELRNLEFFFSNLRGSIAAASDVKTFLAQARLVSLDKRAALRLAISLHALVTSLFGIGACATHLLLLRLLLACDGRRGGSRRRCGNRGRGHELRAPQAEHREVVKKSAGH